MKKTSNEKKIALVLGGGGSRGAYQIGVWQALTDLGIKPDIVVGTSVGAINAAMVAQGDVDYTSQLWKELETDVVFDVPEGFEAKDYLKEIVVNHGAGSSSLKVLLEKYIDEKKVRESGLDIGITTTELKGLKGHKLFLEDIPEGQLIDYIIASASAFPVVQAYSFDGKEYIDGGYSDVLPVGMANHKDATDVIAVNLHGIGQLKTDDLQKANNLIMIESPWDLGLQFIFDKDHTKKIMKLGYLECLKAYGIFDGNYFTYAKGTFAKTTLSLADECAKAFGLDPLQIYTYDSFTDCLSKSISVAINSGTADLKKLEKIGQLSISDIKKIFDNLKSNAPVDSVLVLAIAKNIKEFGNKSIFESHAAKLLLDKQIKAAKFLIKFDLY